MSAQRQSASASSVAGTQALGVDDPLLEEAFDEILDTLKQLHVHRNSPKFFVLYAHYSPPPARDAQSGIAGKYLDWFQRLFMDLNSDKSPHGYRQGHASQHTGASVDIFNNQLCLLPTSWHHHNVDYILVFYSELLADYMRAERRFRHKDHNNQTYSEALASVCSQYKDLDAVPWNEVCDKIRAVQDSYQTAMGETFHYVLTETGLVNFRNLCNASPDSLFSLPILLFNHDRWEDDLKWKPEFVHSKKTQIRLSFRPGDKYWQFLNILSKFETLQPHHHIIRAMKDCFVKLTDMLKQKGWGREAYLKKVEIEIQKALKSIRDPGQYLSNRPVTLTNIRDVLRLHSRAENSSVKRLIGDALLTKLRDIELIVAPEPDRSTSREDSQAPRAAVPIQSLFEERPVENSTTGRRSRPRRILIRGKPGVGKSTLSKRIMYEYCLNKALWDQFEVVVRLPIAKLEASESLAKLLLDEYFKSNSRGDDMSDELERVILGQENPQQQNNGDSKVLIILDGLDEISMKQRHPSSLLGQIVKRNWVIVTSRVYVDSILGEPMELKLDALGLSESSIEAYLSDAAFVPITTSAEIRRLCQSNPSLMDTIRIPIYLDILCYSWGQLQASRSIEVEVDNEEAGGDDEEQTLPTITSLYQAVVSSLWRKDVPKLNRTDHGQLITADLIASIHDAARLERVLDGEIKLLEELAIKMTVAGMQKVGGIEIAQMIRRREDPDHFLPLGLEKNLQKLSVLHSDVQDGQRYYQFFHLTFQEYFAARFLVHNSTELCTYLQNHKYDSRFAVVWTFVAGLVSDSNWFMDQLDLEPRDIIGTQHIYLTMECLHECVHRVDTSHRHDLRQRLNDWYFVELMHCLYSIPSSIASHRAFPESLFKTLIRPEVRDLFSAIRRRSSLSNSLLRLILDLAVRNEGLRDDAWIFGLHENLTLESINIILEQPGRLWALRRQKKLPDQTAPYIISEMSSLVTQHQEYPLPLVVPLSLPEAAINQLIEWSRSKDDSLQAFAKGALDFLRRENVSSRALIKYQIDRFDNALRRLSSDSSKWFSLHNSEKGRQFGVSTEAIPEVFPKLWQSLRGPPLLPAWIVSELASRIIEGHALPNEIMQQLCELPDQFWDEQDLDSDNYKTKRFVVSTLTASCSIPPPRIFQSLAKLLQDPVPDIWMRVLIKLEQTDDLHSDVISELRRQFDGDSDRERIVWVLHTRLHLVPGACDWLIDVVRDERAAILFGDKIFYWLAAQTQLPTGFLTSILSMIPRLQWLTLPPVLALFSDRCEPVDGFRERLPELLAMKNNMGDSGIWISTPTLELEGKRSRWIVLFCQNWFRHDVVALMAKAGTVEMLRNIEWVLSMGRKYGQPEHLDDQSTRLLRSFLAAETTPELTVSKSDLAHRILLHERNIDGDTIKYIDRISYHQSNTDPVLRTVTNTWVYRDISQFCTNVNALDSLDMELLIGGKLEPESRRSVRTAYVHGRNLCYYQDDGTLCRHKLTDETVFRNDFRAAQKKAGLPEWALVKQAKHELR